MPDGIPENTEYLMLGLAVTFGLLGVYILSLIARFNSARKDIEVLERLNQE